MRCRRNWKPATLSRQASRRGAELDPKATGLEGLLERVFAHFAVSLEGLTEWVLVMVDFHQQHRDDPEALTKLARVYSRWRDEVTRFIDVLQANGWIAPPNDPALLTQQVFAYAEGLTVHAAACHSCLQSPETSCERGNKYLDRATLAPTVERENLAFFPSVNG